MRLVGLDFVIDHNLASFCSIPFLTNPFHPSSDTSTFARILWPRHIDELHETLKYDLIPLRPQMHS